MTRKVLKIITCSFLIFTCLLFIQENAVIAQTSNPPLSGNKIQLPLKRDCKKGSELVDNDNCCESVNTVCTAGDTLCLNGGIQLSNKQCIYQGGLTRPSSKADISYIDKQYCADSLGLSDQKFVCGPFITNEAWFKGALCLGPGASNQEIVQGGRVVCCPVYTLNPGGTKNWYFEQYSPPPVNPNGGAWDQCPNEVPYLKSNNLTKVDFKVLTPEQVCEGDSKINSKTQTSAELKQQCCQCITGSDLDADGKCATDWKNVPKSNIDNSWTAIGCINRSQTGLATSLMRIFYGVGLVFLLLKIIIIGFDYQSGDPEKIKEARYGVLAVITAFTVGTVGLIALRFVGLDVLGLGASTNIDNFIPVFK